MVAGSMATNKHDAEKATKSYITIHKEGGWREKREREKVRDRKRERETEML